MIDHDHETADIDSDEHLHDSSDEENEFLAKTASPTSASEAERVSSVHFLLNQPEPDPHHPSSIGSLNHSYTMSSKDDDRGCCMRYNLAWGCLALVVLIALALFINIQYHVGPDSSKLLPFLHRSPVNVPSDRSSSTLSYAGGGGTSIPDDLSDIDLPGTGKGASASRLAKYMSMKDKNLASALPTDSPLASRQRRGGLELDLNGIIDRRTNEQLRQEAQQLAKELNHLHIGQDALEKPHLPGSRPSLGDSISDLEAELNAPPPSLKDLLQSKREIDQLEKGRDGVLRKATEKWKRYEMEHAVARLENPIDPEFEKEHESAADKKLDAQAEKEFEVGFQAHKKMLQKEMKEVENRAKEMQEKLNTQQAAHDKALEKLHELEKKANQQSAKQFEHKKELAHAQVQHAKSHPDQGKEHEDEKEKDKEEDEDDTVAAHEDQDEKEKKDKEESVDGEEGDHEAALHHHKHAKVELNSTVHEGIQKDDEKDVAAAAAAAGALPAVFPLSLSNTVLFPASRLTLPIRSFPFCFHCSDHCAHVVSIIKSHLPAKGISLAEESDSKFRTLQESLPKFFRGNAHLFWQDHFQTRAKGDDLSSLELLLREKYARKGLTETFLNGDTHLLNFGSFDTARFGPPALSSTSFEDGSPFPAAGVLQSEGHVVFDLNDFDQSLLSEQYYHDLTRNLASVIIQMKENSSPAATFTDAHINEVLHAGLSAYHQQVLSFVDNDDELLFQLDRDSELLVKKSPVRKLLKKVENKKGREKMLDNFAPVSDSTHRREFVLGKHGSEDGGKEKAYSIAIDKHMEQVIRDGWERYLQSLGVVHRSRMYRASNHKQSLNTHRFPFPQAWKEEKSFIRLPGALSQTMKEFYHIKDIARRIGSGLGSRGVLRYYILVEGGSDSPDDDIILDMKQEVNPEWVSFTSTEHLQQVEPFFLTSASRVAVVSNAMSPRNTDPHIGFLETGEGSFIIKSRSPFKDDIDVDSLTEVTQWKQLTMNMAQVLAAAHSRADDDYSSLIVPTSFEVGFSKLVPRSEMEAWSHAVTQVAWAEFRRRNEDFGCLLNHKDD